MSATEAATSSAADAAAATAADTTTTTTTNTTTTKKDISWNLVFVGSYVCIAVLWCISPIVLVPYVLHLLLLVTCILYVACHKSIVLLHVDSHNGYHVTQKNEDGTTTVIAPSPIERETLRKEDAMQFPIIGSISLFSLYCAFKFLDKDLVNLLIGVYFGLIGIFAIAMTITPFLSYMVTSTTTQSKQQQTSWLSFLTTDIRWENKLYHPFHTSKTISSWLGLTPEDKFIDWEIIFTIIEVIAGILGTIIVALYYYCGKPWYLNNILGICFCLQGIERFSLGTYKIGAILLIGLFFYDIFWVFGTDVMVTVAKSLDGPIKILLPRSLLRDETTGQFKDLSLLGLGDIVIPGFFLALLLRFDAHKAAMAVSSAAKNDNNAGPATSDDNKNANNDKNTTPTTTIAMEIQQDFPKPYFHTALIAYVCGLGLTLFIMMQFNAAQPALLYLVPACLGSSFITAIVRGEVQELLAYSEEVEDEEDIDEQRETKPEGEGTTTTTDGTTTTTTDETKKEK